MNTRYVIATLLFAAVVLVQAACGQDVWTGYAFFFEKADFADHTLEANQDRITENVWLTRANQQGIFNIAQESGYTANVSPVDTEWATGEAADWASLTFEPWQTWHGSNPPGTVGLNAVAHLVSDHIYVDIRFESWTSLAQGGGFSYYRAEEGSPVEPRTWSAVKALYR